MNLNPPRKQKTHPRLIMARALTRLEVMYRKQVLIGDPQAGNTFSAISRQQDKIRNSYKH